MPELQKATSAPKLSRSHVTNVQSREADSVDELDDTDGEPTILSEEDEGADMLNREAAEEEEENASDG